MNHSVILQGQFFEAGSSKARPARLTVAASDHLEARIIFAAGEEKAVEITAISDRLGAVDRRIELADGHAFTTQDNDGADRLDGLRRGFFSRVSSLETFRPRLLVFLAAIVFLIFAAYRWGLPVVAKVATWATPQEVVEWIDQGSLSSIDQLFVSQTQLPEATRARIRQDFDELVKVNGTDQTFNLQFRGGDRIGPNALALPGGTILVTDPLVNLIDDDELAAVMAHEIAHVNESHGLQQLYRALGFAGLAALIAGDLGVVAEEILAGGGILVAMASSREMELEADAEAVELLRKAGRNPAKLSSALDKLYEAVCSGAIEECEESSWLASHPGGKERRDALERAVQGR